MTGFFPLIEQYSTQDEPAFCGLSSLTMVLNALAIDPRRPWKGAWRWFHERLLDCCLPLSAVASQGVTLDQAACLARCNGAVAELRRSGEFTLEEFRAAVADACATGERHLVVSYARPTFGQTGDGHFSPIGGYHAERDLALILDTARFKYPPHWVPVSMLFEAMKPEDKATGKPRGWLRLSAPPHPQDSVLFTLDVREHGRWRAAERLARGGAASAAREALGRMRAATATAAAAATAEEVVRAVVAAASSSASRRASVGDFVAVRLAARERAAAVHRCGESGVPAAVDSEPCVPLGKRDQLLAELRHMPLFGLVSEALESTAGAGAAGAGAAGAGTAAAAPLSHDHHDHDHDHDHDAPLRDAAQVSAPPGGEDGLLAEKLTVLLFLVDPKQWPLGAEEWGASGAATGGEEEEEGAAKRESARFAALLDVSAVSLVEAEVRYMREQLRYLDAVLGSSRGGGDVEGSAAAAAEAGAAAATATAGGGGSGAGSDCGGNCYTPLDCHVKGHHKTQ
jgi:glutathione gamma-glutamylcysteinyltransferase